MTNPTRLTERLILLYPHHAKRIPIESNTSPRACVVPSMVVVEHPHLRDIVQQIANPDQMAFGCSSVAVSPMLQLSCWDGRELWQQPVTRSRERDEVGDGYFRKDICEVISL